MEQVVSYLHHRLKNNLQTLTTGINLQASRVRAVAAFPREGPRELRVTLSHERERAGTADALDHAILEVNDDDVPLPRESEIGAGESAGSHLVRTLTSQVGEQLALRNVPLANNSGFDSHLILQQSFRARSTVSEQHFVCL
jgi:two-component sensor histidine kinase